MEEKQARAELRHARISSRKVKIVIDTVRGKSAKEAVAILKYTNKAAAPVVNNHQMDESKLYIAEIYANQGPTMKRIMPRARGRANRINKRTSHIVVVLKEA